MYGNSIKICNIITFSEEDFITFKMEFPTATVNVIRFDNINEFDKFVSLPTIIVGWSHIKQIYSQQKISIHCISENLYWTYSVLEEKNLSISKSTELISTFLKKWLPQDYVPYDYLLDGKLTDFLSKNLPCKTMYVYFSGKAMYLYSPEHLNKIIGVSLESIKFAGFDIKIGVSSFIKKYNPICFSYKNVAQYITKGYELNSSTLENAIWAKHTEELTEKNIFDIIMDLDGIRFVPFVMHTIYQTLELNEHEQKYLKYLNKKDVITEWLSNQNLYFKKSYLNERIKFKKLLNGIQYTTLEYSNKRTITGRINCCDKRFNPQMLDKKSEDRAAIVSQYKNGKIVTFDYTSFEIKLALFLCQDEAFIVANKDKDLHAETSKILYNKLDITTEERSIGKSINNTLLYGGGQELILSKMNGVVDSEIKLEEVKKFLEPILEMRQRISDSCKEFGYLINVFGSIIRPEKSWAIFNNFMQALAADILVEKLFLIRDFLSKHKTVFLFQVHDSFIFDFHPDEIFLIDEITKILSSFEKIILPVNHCIGESWQDCTKN